MIYYIKEVCKEDGVIKKVKLSNESEMTKQAVINSIGDGNTFYTDPVIGDQAPVKAIPTTNPKYIRSVPDYELADNLGNLRNYC